MGTCRECHEWHCVCELGRWLTENREQWKAALREHRELCAKNDQAFQRFMAKVLRA
jgi:hypothetical protein